MKKVGNIAEKTLQSKLTSKSSSVIKFNLSDDTLACFKNLSVSPQPKSKTDSLKDYKWLSEQKAGLAEEQALLNLPQNRSRALSTTSSFNQKVVIMHYDNIEVYIDKSTRKKSNSNSSNGSKTKQKKSDSDSGSQDEFLQSCVRVLTE